MVERIPMPKPTRLDGATPRERVLTRTKNSAVTRPQDLSHATLAQGGGLSNPSDRDITQGCRNQAGDVSTAMYRREHPLTRLSTETAERPAE